MSVRLGPTREPARPTRWQFVQRAFAFEDRAAASDVARLHGGGVERVHVAKIGDDARHLGVVQRKGRHAGGWRAGPDEAREVAIGERVAELAAAQIDAADRIALRAVAGCASRRVEARAVGDIDVGILAVVQLLRPLRRSRRRRAEGR